MKAKNYWFIGGLIGCLFMLVPLLSALITANGAFGSDPGERVNRIDFIWVAIGLVVAFYCFYKARTLSANK
jgi:TRAP-type uncharacterized transport system fused permease subunit